MKTITEALKESAAREAQFKEQAIAARQAAIEQQKAAAQVYLCLYIYLLID